MQVIYPQLLWPVCRVLIRKLCLLWLVIMKRYWFFLHDPSHEPSNSAFTNIFYDLSPLWWITGSTNWFKAMRYHWCKSLIVVLIGDGGSIPVVEVPRSLLHICMTSDIGTNSKRPVPFLSFTFIYLFASHYLLLFLLSFSSFSFLLSSFPPSLPLPLFLFFSFSFWDRTT